MQQPIMKDARTVIVGFLRFCYPNIVNFVASQIRQLLKGQIKISYKLKIAMIVLSKQFFQK